MQLKAVAQARLTLAHRYRFEVTAISARHRRCVTGKTIIARDRTLLVVCGNGAVLTRYRAIVDIWNSTCDN